MGQNISTPIDTTIKKRVAEHYNGDAEAYHRRFYRPDETYSPLQFRQVYIEAMIAAVAAPGARMLDVGCGPGELVLSLLRRGYDAYGVDISSGMIGEAAALLASRGYDGRERVRLGDLERLEWPDDSFDIATAAGVIEYQASDAPALKEMYRILRPGGHLILNVTNRITYMRLLEWPYSWLQRFPGARAILGMVKNRIVGRGELHSIPKRRVHSPAAFDATLKSFGFSKVAHNYFHFSPLPPPLSSLFAGVCDPLGRSMERLTRNWSARWLAGGYLVMARKT